MWSTLAPHIYKRAIRTADDLSPGHHEPPTWVLFVALLEFVFLVLPVSLVLEYTLKHLYPTFAIVEDENPPAYEPVALDESPEEDIRITGSKPTSGRSETVTSSLRSVNRLLRNTGGFLANFRGFSVHIVIDLCTIFLIGIFSNGLGGFFTPIATLLASLALVQFSTAWVHIVISQPSPLHFWQRLPPFKHTFDATWRPVMLYWLASEVRRWIPVATIFILGLDVPSFSYHEGRQGQEQPDMGSVSVWKGLVFLIVTIVTSVFVTVPARVILVRVQASLLPVEEDAIIPFDRSFKGLIVPAVIGGRGYATISEAWSTFSNSAWRRLLKLYVKIFVIITTVMMGLVFVLAAQFGMILATTRRDSPE